MDDLSLDDTPTPQEYFIKNLVEDLNNEGFVSCLIDPDLFPIYVFGSRIFIDIEWIRHLSEFEDDTNRDGIILSKFQSEILDKIIDFSLEDFPILIVVGGNRYKAIPHKIFKSMYMEGEKRSNGSVYISEEYITGEELSYDEMVLDLCKELSWEKHK